MNQLLLLAITIVSLVIGSVLGYYARQSIARKKIGSIESELQKKISQAKSEADEIINQAKKKSAEISKIAEEEELSRRKELSKIQSLLFKREKILEERINGLEEKEAEFLKKVQEVKKIKENLENLRNEAQENLARVSQLSKEDAKKELLENLEKEYEMELLGRIRKLEDEGKEKLERRAKDIVVQAIQRCALSQAQEVTTTSVALPNEEIKGRIIGKEGRNIKTLEKLTGVEILIDETPDVVVISGFDPIRRQIAKAALEKLIKDGRIQPAKIEEVVARVQEEIVKQMKESGEAACYDTGILGFDPKLVQLLGRLRFRTSYGQNVLLHSIEVAHLAGVLASEVGGNVQIAKKAGLLHDIGKAVDHQIEGSHTEIGVKILEKFKIEQAVIKAMKSHHEEHPYESLEAILIQTADQISGARPGARKDTLENYLKRLSELENIATSFSGVEKAYAIQAGREVRVFVTPEKIDDFEAKKLARQVADRIQEELNYPGEIKVVVIRETRVIERAR